MKRDEFTHRTTSINRKSDELNPVAGAASELLLHARDIAFAVIGNQNLLLDEDCLVQAVGNEIPPSEMPSTSAIWRYFNPSARRYRQRRSCSMASKMITLRIKAYSNALAKSHHARHKTPGSA